MADLMRTVPLPQRQAFRALLDQIGRSPTAAETPWRPGQVVIRVSGPT